MHCIASLQPTISNMVEKSVACVLRVYRIVLYLQSIKSIHQINPSNQSIKSDQIKSTHQIKSIHCYYLNHPVEGLKERFRNLVSDNASCRAWFAPPPEELVGVVVVVREEDDDDTVPNSPLQTLETRP
mmetsp:Transcript_12294/g.35097  ORF Transcript_12294/g.35097 Transcript_12294/m.35097 type:complete len:128 (-) Transcript_12294:191-574(-)